jgi:hypothetical protein
MKQVLLIFLSVMVFSGATLPQTQKPSSEQALATKFRIEDPQGYQRGPLYITVGGREQKIAEAVTGAWIINGGKEVVYSAGDGAGGYENEGEALHLYDVGTQRTRKILSEYFMIDKVTEVRLRTGATALLVEMSDGGLGASYFAVADPKRGEVFFRRWARLTKIEGDQITLGFHRQADWGAIIEEGRSVKPYKTEKHDLKKVLKNKVIYNKPDSR